MCVEGKAVESYCDFLSVVAGFVVVVVVEKNI